MPWRAHCKVVSISRHNSGSNAGLGIYFYRPPVLDMKAICTTKTAAIDQVLCRDVYPKWVTWPSPANSLRPRRLGHGVVRVKNGLMQQRGTFVKLSSAAEKRALAWHLTAWRTSGEYLPHTLAALVWQLPRITWRC